MTILRQTRARFQEKGVPVYEDDLVVGMDVGQSRHEAMIMQGDGFALGRKMVVHSRSGLQELRQELEAHSVAESSRC